MLVLTRYRGGVYDEVIAGVFNKCSLIMRSSICERRVCVEEIRRLWFGYSTYNPSEYAMTLYNERITGLVFAYVRRDHGYIWICIDPEISSIPQILYDTVYSLLSWSKHRLSLERISDVRINCGYEYSRLCRITEEITGSLLKKYSVVLMVYKDPVDKFLIKPPSGVLVRKAARDDIPGIVDVWNNAFREYEWFEEWSIDDAYNWYSTRKDLIVYVAVDERNGRILGYVEGEIRESYRGKCGYVYTLAVHPIAQGRGLGKFLLRYISNILNEIGVQEVYLDAVKDVVNYYLRQGFRIVSRQTYITTTLNNLPSRPVTIHSLQ